MRPLVGITSYNRSELLSRTLAAFFRSVAGDSYFLQVYDNGSNDGSVQSLDEAWESWRAAHVAEGLEYHKRDGQLFTVTYGDQNIGCPKGLNEILRVRQFGQAFVKVDSDVLIHTPGWISTLQDFEKRYPDAAMIGAWYDGVLGPDNCRLKGETEDAFIVDLLPGHFVWHSGGFMDRVGFFDVLRDDHVYGFEDWIMCHKAHLLGQKIYIAKDVQITDIQTSLGMVNSEKKRDHVERMRPYFNVRLQALLQGVADLYTPPSGVPTWVTREG